jgi:hypothetical protein
MEKGENGRRRGYKNKQKIYTKEENNRNLEIRMRVKY